MAGISEQSHGVARDAVVRSFGRAVERPCARPNCMAPARATLTFDYTTRRVWLEGLADEARPQAYDLCLTHAARTRPPHGWQLRDRRPEDERHPDVPPPTPADLGGDRTVAVLAAALRAVPDPVSEDAVADAAAEVGPAAADASPQPRPALAARDRQATDTPALQAADTPAPAVADRAAPPADRGGPPGDDDGDPGPRPAASW